MMLQKPVPPPPPPPHHTNVCKIWRLCGAIPSLLFNKSRSNLASSLILKCSFYQYQRTFANWIQSKVKKSWVGLFGIKIWRLCEAISLLVFNKSRSNLASSLILKSSFYQYRRTFANWIQSKVEKIVDGSKFGDFAELYFR